MKQPTISSEEYLARGAGCCPFCGSGDISAAAFVQVEGTGAWQDVTCNECHHNWQDSFVMTGYTTEWSEQPDDEEEAS